MHVPLLRTIKGCPSHGDARERFGACGAARRLERLGRAAAASVFGAQAAGVLGAQPWRSPLAQVNGSVYSASAMPRTATIRYDAPASAEAAVRTMDGTRLRSHTLKVHRRRMPCTRA